MTTLYINKKEAQEGNTGPFYYVADFLLKEGDCRAGIRLCNFTGKQFFIAQEALDTEFEVSGQIMTNQASLTKLELNLMRKETTAEDLIKDLYSKGKTLIQMEFHMKVGKRTIMTLATLLGLGHLRKERVKQHTDNQRRTFTVGSNCAKELRNA